MKGHKSLPHAESGSLNPGGALLPLLGKFDSTHLARYIFAKKYVYKGFFLDFGCGYGFGTSTLASETSSHGLGVDADPSCIRYAIRHFSTDYVTFRHAVDMELPIPDQSIDTIIAFEVLEHLSPSDVEAFFRESARILRPHGTIVGSTPNASGKCPDDFVFHLHEFSPRELRDLTSRHGFECTLLGFNPNELQTSNLQSKVLTRIPRSLKRSRLMKLIQSLSLSLQADAQIAENLSLKIGADIPEFSSDLIFVLRARSPTQPVA